MTLPSTPLSAGRDALSLLATVERDTPLFLATPRHWLASEPGAALQPLHARSAELPSRAIEALAAARHAGQPEAAIVGALPFDPDLPAQLHLTPRLLKARPVPVQAPPSPAWTQEVQALPSGARYAQAVGEAVARMRQGALEKVVLARTLLLRSPALPGVQDLLTRLLARHPQALTFSARTGPGRCLVGASPELLVRRTNGWLQANPLAGSLLAYVAKDIYGLDQTGLGWLLATYAGGALLGSIVLSTHGAWIRPARTMVVAALLWFSLNLAFSWVRAVGWGAPLLFVTGFVQSFCMVPMAVILLRTADPAFRGRVMGVRMLAVYGLPMGLLLSGPLVEHLGFAFTGSLYSVLGIVCTLAIAVGWRAHLWHPHAAANMR